MFFQLSSRRLFAFICATQALLDGIYCHLPVEAGEWQIEILAKREHWTVWNGRDSLRAGIRFEEEYGD